MNKQESQLTIDRLKSQINALEINTHVLNNWDKSQISGYSETVEQAKADYRELTSFHIFVTLALNIGLSQELNDRFLVVTSDYKTSVSILNALEDVCGQIASAKENYRRLVKQGDTLAFIDAAGAIESLEDLEHDLREELEIAAL